MTNESVINLAQVMRAMAKDRRQLNERFGDDSRAYGEYMIEKVRPFLTEEQVEIFRLAFDPEHLDTEEKGIQ